MSDPTDTFGGCAVGAAGHLALAAAKPHRLRRIRIVERSARGVAR